MVRSALLSVVSVILVYGAKYLPIFVLMITFNTAPFWAAGIAYFMNGSKPTKCLLACMVGCFVGILVIALPKTGLIGGPGIVIHERSEFLLTFFGILFCAFGYSLIMILGKKMPGLSFSLI